MLEIKRWHLTWVGPKIILFVYILSQNLEFYLDYSEDVAAGLHLNYHFLNFQVRSRHIKISKNFFTEFFFDFLALTLIIWRILLLVPIWITIMYWTIFWTMTKLILFYYMISIWIDFCRTPTFCLVIWIQWTS